MAQTSCTECGFPIDDADAFCGSCGAPRGQSGDSPGAPRPSPRPAAPRGAPRSGPAYGGPPLIDPKRAIRWVVVAVIVLIGLAIADSYFNRYRLNRNIDQLIAEQQYSAAIQLLQQKLQSSPNDARLYFLMAKCYLAQGDLNDSQQFFEKAVSLDSGDRKPAADAYFQRGIKSARAATAKQMFDLAIGFDPSRGPAAAKWMLEQGETAFKLRDLNAAGDFFQSAVNYDPSVKPKVAADFAQAVTLDPNFTDLASDEHYAKLAADYDRATARAAGEKLFTQLSQGLCNLKALGRGRFDAMMKLTSDLGISDATKTSAAYRFAYALQLYDTPSRPQAIDILTDVSNSGTTGCPQLLAKYLLQPPPPGRINEPPGQPVTFNGIIAQLLYVDIGANTIKLTFSMRAGDQAKAIQYAPLGNKNGNPPLYIEDDNGQVLSTTTGLIGGRQSKICCGAISINLAAGEAAQLSAAFPMISSGARKFKFVAPVVAFSPNGWGMQLGRSAEWEWPNIEVKRGLFE